LFTRSRALIQACTVADGQILPFAYESRINSLLATVKGKEQNRETMLGGNWPPPMTRPRTCSLNWETTAIAAGPVPATAPIPWNLRFGSPGRCTKS